MLDDVLTPLEKEELPALGSLGDGSGSKRLTKLNSILKKSPPLKPWTLRNLGDSTVKLFCDSSLSRRRH